MSQSPQNPSDPYGDRPAYEPPAYQPPVDYGAPQTSISPAQERTLGSAAHWVPLVAMVLSAGTLGFIGSLVIYLMYKDRGPFVRQHAANSLNVQIITGIVLLVSFPLMLVLVGFLTFGLAFVFAFVVHLIGAVKAHNGEWWDPPMTPRFVR
ncbi:DUF4870 domain-containing protein [Nocardioides sp. P5_C9_2]